MIAWDGVTPYTPPENSVLIESDYAGIGDTYDPIKKVFIKPQPYPSWILNEETNTWEAPISKPNDGNRYYWDENSVSWLLFE